MVIDTVDSVVGQTEHLPDARLGTPTSEIAVTLADQVAGQLL